MYLKNIEVNGFKSFANKIDFKFEQGITGIVGPNGSGKSNVADAVRWVLGEQSAKKLRGANMEDVIFSGTEQRKPQGAAYVAITLDNSDKSLPIDYSEVTVARRVYRSGESEYLINGNPSRLKDITRLFFDTGIGKEGYSIIGQGQIERILSDKPEDRRALFDEAAGIVKYKKNKEITEKNLEAEHVNLNRVNDILSGLEERVEPLRIQSEKAKEYLSFKEELKKLEINSFLFEVDKLDEKLKENNEKLEITQADIERVYKEFEYTKQEYNKLEEELSQLEEEIDEYRNLLNDKKVADKEADGQMEVIQTKIESEEKSGTEIHSQIERYKAEIIRLEKEIEETTKKKDGIQDVLREKSDILKKAEFARDKALMEEEAIEQSINSAKADIIDFMNEGGSLKEKIARYDTMLENIELRRTELRSKYLADKSEEEKASAEKKTLTSEKESIEEGITRYTRELEKAEADLRASTDRSNDVKNEISKYTQQVISLQSRHESLRNLTERYEGYGVSIRKVMEKKAQYKGIVGVVADIIKVDEEYETAIETSLGGSIQNIVTEDEGTAKDMIAYLRTNKLGRATFLPITTVQSRGSVDPDALKEKGVIGVASKLVKTDPKYSGIIESLLGRSIVVDNIDNAIDIAKKYRQTLRLVTPTGELINPGGAMTGGAFRNSSNLLGRKRELDEITKEIGETNNLLRKAREEETNLKMKRDSLKEQRDNFQKQIQRLSIDQNSVNIRLSGIEEKLSAIEADFASINMENQELQTQVKQIEDNKAELFDSGKQAENAINDRNVLIEKLEKELTEKKEERTARENDVQAATLEASTVKQSEGYIESDLIRLGLDKDRVEDEIENCRERLLDQSDNVEALQEEYEELKKQKADNATEMAKIADKLAELTTQREDINKNHKQFFEKRDGLTQQISGLEKSEYSLKMTLEKLESDKDNLTNYMWEEYQMTYSAAAELRDEECGTAASLKKDINSVKQKIKALGDVNVNAIEEYKDVSERYFFLKGQRDDILQAEANLKSIIADLDKAMKETFAEKFKDIQEMFAKVFKELFGGGKASLTLVDEENLLETGVIINAQPPGKKLQNMMQLSGGEKSLTAISLLFAIQSLKPSPFCILDEIEAALDDANVGHFAHYLDRLTKSTQFIVITHRKGTMEAANRLYGITMQEKGVSTLVSVNLIEDDLDD